MKFKGYNASTKLSTFSLIFRKMLSLALTRLQCLAKLGGQGVHLKLKLESRADYPY